MDRSSAHFRVKLPLTDKVLYKRYSVWSWPIPGNSTEYNVEIQVPSDFAFHTVTGGIFQPTFCQGEHPMICRAGAIFDRTRFQCPRGILTAELSLRKQCRITLTKVLTTFTTVHEILPGVGPNSNINTWRKSLASVFRRSRSSLDAT